MAQIRQYFLTQSTIEWGFVNVLLYILLIYTWFRRESQKSFWSDRVSGMVLQQTTTNHNKLLQPSKPLPTTTPTYKHTLHLTPFCNLVANATQLLNILTILITFLMLTHYYLYWWISIIYLSYKKIILEQDFCLVLFFFLVLTHYYFNRPNIWLNVHSTNY